MGIINAGTAVGSVLAAPVIADCADAGWRMVFFGGGGVGDGLGAGGLLSIEAIMMSSNMLDARALGEQFTFAELIGINSVRAVVFAKFMSDSAWYFYLFWLPKYLYDVRGFDVKHVGTYAWIPYAASGVGSFVGGGTPACCCAVGDSLDVARKIALGLSAAFMPVVMLVPQVPVQAAIVLFSIAFFCQQSWSGLMMTLPADIFPLSRGGDGVGSGRLRRCDWRSHLRPCSRTAAGPWIRLWDAVRAGWDVPSDRLSRLFFYLPGKSNRFARMT